MKKSLLILLVILNITSCKLFTQTDEDILTDEEFKSVLLDIHLTNAIMEIEESTVLRDSLKMKMYYESILTKHNTSISKLNKTIKFYSTHPTEYNKIYEQVLEELSEKERNLRERAKDDEQRQTLKELKEN